MEPKLIKLNVDYIAKPLREDPDYAGPSQQKLVKEFVFQKNEQLEDLMDCVKVYLWKLHKDEDMEILSWKIDCVPYTLN